LGMAGGTKYLPVLEKGLRDKRGEVVRHAITGLSRTPDPQAVAMLEKYLEKGEFQLMAMTALMKIGRRQDFIEQAFKLYDRTVARNLELAMGMGFVRRDAAKIDYWKNVLYEMENEQTRNLEDCAFFEGALGKMNADELQKFARAMSATENRHLTRLFYSILATAPREDAMKARQVLKEAKLHSLRVLAVD
jgi:hypothetical protein